MDCIANLPKLPSEVFPLVFPDAHTLTPKFVPASTASSPRASGACCCRQEPPQHATGGSSEGNASTVARIDRISDRRRALLSRFNGELAARPGSSAPSANNHHTNLASCRTPSSKSNRAHRRRHRCPPPPRPVPCSPSALTRPQPRAPTRPLLAAHRSLLCSLPPLHPPPSPPTVPSSQLLPAALPYSSLLPCSPAAPSLHRLFTLPPWMPEAGRPSRHRELGPLPALRLPGLGAHPRPPASSLSPSHAAPHVLDSVLRETEARVREEVEAKRRREREKERRRRKKHLVATVISLSSFALFMVSGHLISRRYENHDMSQSFLSSEHNHYKFGSFDCVVRQPDGHLRAWDAAPNCRRGFDG